MAERDDAVAYLLPGAGGWEEEVRTALGELAAPPRVALCESFGVFLQEAATRAGLACVIAHAQQPDGELRHLAREIVALRPSPSLLVLARDASVEEAVACVRAGASDFLELPFERGRLLAAFAGALERARRWRALRARREALERRFASVSPREREVLACLGDGSSSKSIAEQLRVSKRTIDYHRGQLILKVGVESSLELVALSGELRYLREVEALAGRGTAGAEPC